MMRWRNPLMLGRGEPAGLHPQKAARLAALPVQIDRHKLRCIYRGTTTSGKPFRRQALFVLAGIGE